MSKFEIIPALATMFDENQNVDEKAQTALVDYLIDSGADALYIGGSTGEGFYMTPDERKKLLELSISHANKRIKCIAYTGANDTKTAIELSQFAEKCGADAISSVRPIYGGFSAGQIKQYYSDMANSVKIPLLVYNNAMAQLSGLSDIKELCAMDNCLGIKYTLHNHFEMELIKQMIGDKKVYSGADEMFFSACLTGVDGAIGSCYNFAMDLFSYFRNVVNCGDISEIKRMNSLNTEFVSLLLSSNFIGMMKWCISKLSCGTNVLRSPGTPVCESDFMEFKSKLSALGKKYSMKDIKIFNL